jgi:hypothetical protein
MDNIVSVALLYHMPEKSLHVTDIMTEKLKIVLKVFLIS